MRRLRPYLVGVAAGALLMLGGQALADIPDSQPSVVDPSHTFYVCVYNEAGSSPNKNIQALDKSKGNCPTGWTEHQLAPVLPTTTTP